LLGNEARHVRENVIRLVFQQRLAVLLELAAAAHLLIHRNLPARHTVVRNLRIHVQEVGAEEADLFQRVIAHREDAVAVARRLDQRMLVIAILRAEHVLDEMPLGHRGAEHVVEHRVMAGMAFDDPAHRRDFMRIKDRAEVGAITFEHGRQRRGDAHVFVAQDHARLGDAGRRSERVQRCDRRRREAHVLLVVPDVFILAGIDPELLPQHVLELADLLRVKARYVDQQDLRD
jgi:hypothetical protein